MSVHSSREEVIIWGFLRSPWVDGVWSMARSKNSVYQDVSWEICSTTKKEQYRNFYLQGNVYLQVIQPVLLSEREVADKEGFLYSKTPRWVMQLL